MKDLMNFLLLMMLFQFVVMGAYVSGKNVKQDERISVLEKQISSKK